MTDYNKQVEALRHCADSRGMVNCNTICEYGWRDSYGCKNILMTDAADAIEALQDTVQAQDKALKECARQLAKMGPKRGEWKTTDAFPHRVYCSNCFRTYVPSDRWQIWVDKPGEGGLERNYCPSCGAKMEVQE